jgi:hypothetical protein
VIDLVRDGCSLALGLCCNIDLVVGTLVEIEHCFDERR